jgi:3-deoxy-7-phosphoheptulonate synthase
VHPHPEQALCDGPQALIDTDLGELAQIMTDFPPLLGKSAAAAIAV